MSALVRHAFVRAGMRQPHVAVVTASVIPESL
jgi:hypothetical protein